MEELTPMRGEALQEIINISFGRASASLGELLNLLIGLTVPDIQEIKQSQIWGELERLVGIDRDITIIQQSFTGALSGEVLLTMPSYAGKQFIAILGQEAGFTPDLPMTELEMEAFLEIGNIMIGACMGGFVDLLDTSVGYEVPTIILDKKPLANLDLRKQNNGGKAILVRTKFSLGDKALTGFLLILLSQYWFDALYLALDKFIEQAL